jgi:hypothetical protein
MGQRPSRLDPRVPVVGNSCDPKRLTRATQPNRGDHGFGNPDATVFADKCLWLPTLTRLSVTEIDAGEGSWVQTVSGGSHGFSGPLGIAFDGTPLGDEPGPRRGD